MKKAVLNSVPRKNQASDINDQRIKLKELAIAHELQIVNEYLQLTRNRTPSFQLSFKDISFIDRQWDIILTIAHVTQRLITKSCEAVNELTAFNLYLSSAYSSNSNFLVHLYSKVILDRTAIPVTRIKTSFLFKLI